MCDNTQQRAFSWKSTSMERWLDNKFLLYCRIFQQRSEKLRTLRNDYFFISDHLRFSFHVINIKKHPENTTHGTIAVFYVIYDCISTSCVDLNSCLSRENENAAQWKWGAGISRSLRLAIQWPAHQHVCSQETTPAFRGLMRQCSVLTAVVPEFFYFEIFYFFFLSTEWWWSSSFLREKNKHTLMYDWCLRPCSTQSAALHTAQFLSHPAVAAPLATQTKTQKGP